MEGKLINLNWKRSEAVLKTQPKPFGYIWRFSEKFFN